MSNETKFKFQEIIKFWFEELEPKDWWKKDDSFDQMIKDRFLEVHAAATRCELYLWRKSPLGRLAEIIVLDQFSRNIFRNKPESFAFDALALSLSQEAHRIGADKELADQQRHFLAMPYMHSESPVIHKVALELFSQQGMERTLDFEIRHKEIVDRFGRYPHRNEILGRKSTPEEVEFLKQPGSSF